jgi:dienelactone hydrolase
MKDEVQHAATRGGRWLPALLLGVAGGAAATPGVQVLDIEGIETALGDSIRAVLFLPAGASAAAPVPACIVLHGSGGLFRENLPGEACGPALEANFEAVAQTLAGLGVASLLPSSFDSRDARFCEDNDDQWFQFAPPPFFNEGDGPKVRDANYDIRRLAIRTIDALAASEFLCSREDVDCNRICVVGASNGGSILMSYVANDLQRHLVDFLDTGSKREHETNANFQERQTAFANFPAVSADLQERLVARPQPRFAQAVSPGCFLRKLVPTILPTDAAFDPLKHLDDLYYPAAPTELHLEIGLEDDVPVHCYDGALREAQALAYAALSGSGPLRYLVETHEAGHDLLRDRRGPLLDKLSGLVEIHFFGNVFHNGFESP